MDDPVMLAAPAPRWKENPAPPDDKTYHVRQYRPAFFEGFENGVAHNIKFDALTSPPWFRWFEHEWFDRWLIEPYGNPSPELIISAIYKSGERWVAGFACDVNNPFAKDWRYGVERGNPAMSAWQPMRTAPRDDVDIEGLSPDGAIREMRCGDGGGWGIRSGALKVGTLLFSNEHQPIAWRSIIGERLPRIVLAKPWHLSRHTVSGTGLSPEMLSRLAEYDRAFSRKARNPKGWD